MIAAVDSAQKKQQETNEYLRCSTCNRAYAFVQHGVLVVLSRHGSEKHLNAISLDKMISLLRAEGWKVDPPIHSSE